MITHTCAICGAQVSPVIPNPEEQCPKYVAALADFRDAMQEIIDALAVRYQGVVRVIETVLEPIDDDGVDAA